MGTSASHEDCEEEIKALQSRLHEAEETLRAISNAEVDAFLMQREQKKKVFLLQDADLPYRILIERMNEGALTINSRGTILYCNGFMARMLKLDYEKAVGDNLYQYLLPGEEAKFYTLLEQAKEGSSRGKIALKACDGTECQFQFSLAPLFVEELPDAFCLIVADLSQQIQVENALQHANEQMKAEVAERKKKEEELESMTKQLRALAARTESIREEERKRIATEIHDTLGQTMTVMKINLAFITKWLRDDLALGRIKTMHELIDWTLETSKRISRELRPATLDLGLTPALEWHCQQFQDTSGIACYLTSQIDEENPDKDVSIALYRITQEALTNVMRHANASRVDVELYYEGEFIVMEIIDNGGGINQVAIHDRNALGILGMKERAYYLGGDVEISSEKGKGTRVIVRIPCHEAG